MNQVPYINAVQKIVLYETKARFFIVGSNNTETVFRVLKIDRTEPKRLNIVNDDVEYTQRQIRDMLMMIDFGNRSKQMRTTAGLFRTVSAFGIVGFVRFLQGYYIILITKRRKIALIGAHTIYKIEDTSMVYIPNDSAGYNHPDESKYVKMFQNVDLSSNFYYSYSYDVTHTLQYNMTPAAGLAEKYSAKTKDSDFLKLWQTSKKNIAVHDKVKSDDGGGIEDASKSFTGFDSIIDLSGEDSDIPAESPVTSPIKHDESEMLFGLRNKANRKFVWNNYLLRNFENVVHSDWILYIIHGFFGQSNINVYNKPLYLTVIARRSNLFAGTRFLKRGANCKGQTANEVETEQILQDASTLISDKCKFTSFVQVRGSVPLFWSQDVSKMVPKPTIVMDLGDPYAVIAGKHFNEVIRNYGAPIIVLNLVKKREKKKQESTLTEQYRNAIQYLNQFLPPEHCIQYIGFDMARLNKSKNANVLSRLADIAEICVKKVGFFHTSPDLYCQKISPNLKCAGLGFSETIRRQHGVIRTNCVDCLDRTNTAQFAIGKCALAFQLHALGILKSPSLEFDTDCVRMLEELYEDQGDTLALQYGGSQLVHRIQTYRKIAPWTSHSRDIMQTLSRYYSNTFGDSDKQQAINLFLGIFDPKHMKQNIWELSTDYYLHNPAAMGKLPKSRKLYSQWWDEESIESLPWSAEETNKSAENVQLLIHAHKDDERVNQFWDYYKPYELTTLKDLYCCHMTSSIRDFKPKYSLDESPFAVRAQPGRRQEETGGGPVEVNPNLSGKESLTSQGSDGSTSSSAESDVEGDIDIPNDWLPDKTASPAGYISLKDLFPTMKETYGVEIAEPHKQDVILYKRHYQIGVSAVVEPEERNGKKVASKGTTLIHKSTFPMDSIYHVTPPTVSRQSKDVYNDYLMIGINGPKNPSKRNMALYQQYVRNKYM
ncbi:polyphosphoinositide phosphatase-like [Tubulanus polymorphus]|uniref:polyphosphoinositide phosphatase-like n=1 Tax=Tubulanus polymorphus TaxID=672921 RepID=UPI003DA4827A